MDQNDIPFSAQIKTPLFYFLLGTGMMGCTILILTHCTLVIYSLSPGLRILVMLLLDTLPMLGNVLMLCFFVFFIFGIVGVQLWKGLLRNRCYLELPANVSIGGG